MNPIKGSCFATYAMIYSVSVKIDLMHITNHFALSFRLIKY